jgi:hypothetical protein
LIHDIPLLSNPKHALIEGWAEFMEGLFDGGMPNSAASGTASVYSLPFGSLGSHKDEGALDGLGVPPNRGESVEGAFANGLWEICNAYVIPGAAKVPESRNGNVLEHAAWITDAGAKSRFMAMYWAPLHELRPKSGPTTRDFITKMKSMHPGVWPTIVPHLHKYNLAKDRPTITAITPNSGLAVGGQPVTITGTEFTNGTRVRIDGGDAVVMVQNSTTLSVTTPARNPSVIGHRDVVITTTGGSATLVAGYEYVAGP